MRGDRRELAVAGELPLRTLVHLVRSQTADRNAGDEVPALSSAEDFFRVPARQQGRRGPPVTRGEQPLVVKVGADGPAAAARLPNGSPTFAWLRPRLAGRG
jgi:hypothetical protein